MAHSEQEAPEAVDVPAVDSTVDPEAALRNMFAAENEPETDEADDIDDLLDEEGDEPETDEEEADEDEGEQEQPAIDPPVSLNAEEKAVFSQLPEEAQAAWAASETRRNTQVQEATTRAKDAQREAEQAAASAQAQAETRFGEQLKAFTAAFEPQAPDPAAYNDMHAYQRDKAIFDHQKAQFDQLEQQVSGIGIETPEQRQARIEARDEQLKKIPEIANEETRDEFINTAFKTAVELGYDVADLAENMDAKDLNNLARIAKAFEAEAELARIKSGAQARKRDKQTGRFKSLKPGAAQPQRSGNKAFDQAKQRLKETGSMDAAQAAFKAIL